MIPVSEFTKDTRFEGPLLVRSAEQRAASNGSRYLDMMLGDRTGDVNAKLWDGAYAPPAAGSIVKVRGQILEYNGRLQLRVERMRLATPQDEVALESLVPCAPEKGEDMLAEIL
ncbi:MAG TPA: OB-fold nucleic acid binding domain-containing protein, partial [Clostridia bacterium]|nr:OB-fold nucleic acid binding domain-containing protein [Clostridia bacterium]